MGIERIEIEGFRSLKHVVWEPSNLNVLIGPNGSGKSNLLDALDLLGSIAQNKFDDALERAGGIRAATWNHSVAGVTAGFKGLRWKVTLQGNTASAALTYDLQVRNFRDSSGFSVVQESLSEGTGCIFHRDMGRQVFLRGRTPLLNVALAHAEFFLPRAALHEKVGVPSQVVVLQLEDWKCYQDMPVGPEAEVRRSAKARIENHVEPDGRNLASVIHTHYEESESFKSAIDDAMRAGLGDDFEKLWTGPAEDGRVQLRLKWRSLKDSLSAFELSDGILRFLLLVTILSQPDPPPLIAIDEPETGLHPSMLPIIAEYAVEASRKTQVILTTHSPEFLDAFRDTIPKVTVAMWEDGQTVLKSPPKDKLDYWLKEYTLGSLMSSGELEGEAEK